MTPPLTCPSCLHLAAITHGVPCSGPGGWLPCIACRVLGPHSGPAPTFTAFAQHCPKTPWTREEVCTAVTEWIAVHRAIPYKESFRPACHLPSYWMMFHLYKGLDNFYAQYAGSRYADAYRTTVAARYARNARQRHLMPQGWTRATIATAVLAWIVGHEGEVPMTKHFERCRTERLPSASTVYRIYGGLELFYTELEDGAYLVQFTMQAHAGQVLGGQQHWKARKQGGETQR